jgi:hypothetical protein
MGLKTNLQLGRAFFAFFFVYFLVTILLYSSVLFIKTHPAVLPCPDPRLFVVRIGTQQDFIRNYPAEAERKRPEMICAAGDACLDRNCYVILILYYVYIYICVCVLMYIYI